VRSRACALARALPRARPLYEFLSESLGISSEQFVGVLLRRPSLLGLKVDTSLRKIVEYLRATDTPPETIVDMVLRSI
jgi:hypothetical protein